MPIKLIAMLVVAVLTALFTGKNIGNSCDVWIIRNFENVPVSVTIIVSLMVGVVITLPFTMGRRVTREDRKILKADKKAKKIKAKQDRKAKKTSEEPKPAEESAVPPVEEPVPELDAPPAQPLLQDSTVNSEYDSEHIPSEAD